MNNLLENKNMLENTFKSIAEISNLILADYTLELNDYIDAVYQKWIIEQETPSDNELEDIVSRIPLYLYRTTGIKESLATKEDLACIQSIKIKPGEFGDEREIKFYDKKGSLELLGKHLGMFKDKVEIEADMELNINIDYGDKEDVES